MAQHEQTRHVMKCEDLLALLGEYVDGSIEPSLCEEFERHMSGCNPCQVVVDNIQKTITLYRAGEVYELPSPFRNRLHQCLRERWRQCHDCPPADLSSTGGS